MSDETGVANAPPVEAPAVVATEPAEAPITTDAVETTAPDPTLEPVGGKSAGRRNALHRAKAANERHARALEVQAQTKDQPREDAGTPEGGQFKGIEGESTEPEVVADAPTEVATTPEAVAADSTVTDPGQQSPPTGFVDIPLPDGHPLRDRGRTHIRALQDQEADVRNGINAAVKLRQAESERDTMKRDLALMQARTAALAGDNPRYETDPRYQALFAQIKEAPGFGDEMAEEVLAALRSSDELRTIKAEQNASLELDVQRTVTQFSDAVHERSAEVLQIWAQGGELQYRLPPLLQQYCQAVDRRNERDSVNTQPTVGEFFHWARSAYQADPRVQAAVDTARASDTEREKARIRQEVAAELKAEQAKNASDAEARHGVRPPLGGAAVSRTPVTDAPAPEREAPTKPGQYRKQAKSRIRDKYPAPPR